jgi:uncharacterized protein
MEVSMYNNYDLQNSDIRKPTLSQISILYSIAVILLLYVGFRAQRANTYPGLLITEFGLILVPSLALLFYYRYDVKNVLRLNKVGALNLFLVFWIMVFALPVVGVLNLINLVVIHNIFGRVIVTNIPNANNSVELIRNVLIIAGSAALCEETMFRGIIQRGLERFGAVKAILVTAFLFGLLHLDFQRLLGTFLLGALIGFLVYRSNSIYSGMFAHFCNNAFAVILGYIGAKVSEIAKTSGVSPVNNDIEKMFSSLLNMPREQLIAVIVTWGVIFVICAIIFSGLILGYIYNTSEKAQKVRQKNTPIKKAGLLWLAPGLFFVTLMYFTIGVKLHSPTSALAERLAWLLGMR